MAGVVMTGGVLLIETLAYMGKIMIVLIAWGTWQAVRTGVLTWTRDLERFCLGAWIIFALGVPPDVWRVATAPSVEHAYFALTDAVTVWYFARAWWKLHKDGPNNGRRRRRAKYALKRLGGRLVPASTAAPARG